MFIAKCKFNCKALGVYLTGSQQTILFFYLREFSSKFNKNLLIEIEITFTN